MMRLSRRLCRLVRQKYDGSLNFSDAIFASFFLENNGFHNVWNSVWPTKYGPTYFGPGRSLPISVEHDNGRRKRVGMHRNVEQGQAELHPQDLLCYLDSRGNSSQLDGPRYSRLAIHL